MQTRLTAAAFLVAAIFSSLAGLHGAASCLRGFAIACLLAISAKGTGGQFREAEWGSTVLR